MADRKPPNSWEREFDKQMDQLLQATGPARRDVLFGQGDKGDGNQPVNPFVPHLKPENLAVPEPGGYGFDDEDEESPTVVISTHELFQARNKWVEENGEPEAAPEGQKPAAWETGAEDIKALSNIDIKPLQMGPDGELIQRQSNTPTRHIVPTAPVAAKPKKPLGTGNERKAQRASPVRAQPRQQSVTRASNKATKSARPVGQTQVSFVLPEAGSNGGFYAFLGIVTVAVVASLALFM